MASFEFNLDTTELTDYSKVLAGAGRKLGKVGDGITRTTGQAIVDTAQGTVAFLSGDLHDSIGLEERSGGVDVVATAGHAGFVEFGTVNMAPQPFLRPAFRKHRDPYRKALLAASVGVLSRKSFVGAVKAPGGIREGTSAGRARGSG